MLVRLGSPSVVVRGSHHPSVGVAEGLGQVLAELQTGAQQARFAHALRSEYQQGFLCLRPASKAVQLLCALDATQIFKGRLALVSG